jgi:hypothetical protein
MIALAALPQKWEMLISIVTGNVEMSDLDLGKVRDAIITQFQADSVCHGSNKHNANKISTVKCKCGDPNWCNQQGSNQQQQQNQQQQGHDGQAKHKHSKRAGKGKAKQADQSQHSHIANVASMAPPTTSTIVLPAPSGMHKCTITCPAPKQHTPSPYKAFNAAVDTAQASGSKPIIQMVKTLEQRITDTYLESPWAKVSHISDVEDSNIEMHPPKGKEDQGDWVFEEADEEAGKGEEADPSFEPLSPSTEPLDWGSDLDDGELCICPSSLPCQVHNLTESRQLLRRQRCMAEPSKGALTATSESGLRMLPKLCCQSTMDRGNSRDCRHSCTLQSSSVNLGDSKCEHGQLYIFCGRCKERWTKPTWLLDSGASSHFCFNLNDFIEYRKYKPYERTPVTTAAHTIYVEGKGAVLLKHMVDGKTVRTCLEHVLHVVTAA